jgi:hypothetical protein
MNTLDIPPTQVDITAWTNVRHICETHGLLSLEYLTGVATSFQGATAGIQGRRLQDNSAFALMLRNSLTQEAQQILVAEAKDYTINGVESGILLFKVILRETMVNASVDPSVIRTLLSELRFKFEELNFDIRKIVTSHPMALVRSLNVGRSPLTAKPILSMLTSLTLMKG